jgi:hypothetical protein
MEVLKRGDLRNREEMSLARAFALYFPRRLMKSVPSPATESSQRGSIFELKTSASQSRKQNVGQCHMNNIQANLEASYFAMEQRNTTSIVSGFDGFNNIWSPSLENFPEDANIDFRGF